jgi:hypothetical protein
VTTSHASARLGEDRLRRRSSPDPPSWSRLEPKSGPGRGARHRARADRRPSASGGLRRPTTSCFASRFVRPAWRWSREIRRCDSGLSPRRLPASALAPEHPAGVQIGDSRSRSSYACRRTRGWAPPQSCLDRGAIVSVCALALRRGCRTKPSENTRRTLAEVHARAAVRDDLPTDHALVTNEMAISEPTLRSDPVASPGVCATASVPSGRLPDRRRRRPHPRAGRTVKPPAPTGRGDGSGTRGRSDLVVFKCRMRRSMNGMIGTDFQARRALSPLSLPRAPIRVDHRTLSVRGAGIRCLRQHDVRARGLRAHLAGTLLTPSHRATRHTVSRVDSTES